MKAAPEEDDASDSDGGSSDASQAGPERVPKNGMFFTHIHSLRRLFSKFVWFVFARTRVAKEGPSTKMQYQMHPSPVQW